MKNVLFISYLFPPILNSGTYRSIKFVRYLPKNGYSPIVLTVENPPDRPLNYKLLNLVPNEIKIYRVPLFSRILAERIAKIFPFKYKKIVADGVEWRLRNLFFIPDVHASWYPSALKKGLDIIKQDKIDIIYATGYPWTSFLIAYKISSKTRIPFVIDYRDPWTGDDLWPEMDEKCFKTFLQKKIAPFLEKKIARKASAIIVTTDSFAEILKENLSIKANKIYTITNGFDPGLFQSKEKLIENSSKLHIVYTGIWKSGYGLYDLYEALKLLKKENYDYYKKVRVTCAGFSPGVAKRYGLDDIVHELGSISYTEAVKLIKSADILFLTVPSGRFSRECLPGKFFDYIGAQKPILIVSDPEAFILKICKSEDFIYWSEPRNIKKLTDVIISLLENNNLRKKKPSDEFRKQFDISYLTKRLVNVFERCLT